MSITANIKKAKEKINKLKDNFIEKVYDGHHPK